MSQEYFAFVEKFKRKKTSDDCYTPEKVYQAIAEWVCCRYHLKKEYIVRPFWQDSDYMTAEYPPECVVLDNPPFSILSQIVRWYCAHNIRFFLFAPGLTVFSSANKHSVTCICAGANITYENGAAVNTSFITNLESPDIVAMSSPELYQVIQKADSENQKYSKKQVAKLSFPDDIVTSAKINYLSNHCVDYQLRRSECVSISKLDSYQKGIFGRGYLLSRQAAARQAAARQFELSEKEREIQKMLDAGMVK